MVCMTEGSKLSSINPVFWLLYLLLKSKSCFFCYWEPFRRYHKAWIYVTFWCFSNRNGVSVEVKQNLKGTVERTLQVTCCYVTAKLGTMSREVSCSG